MRFSVIIIGFNGEDFIGDCLRSVRKSLEGASYEIIVIDNGSTDGTLDIIKMRFPGVALIENSQNLGFSPAVNQGIEKCGGEYIFILNQDTRIQCRAIERLAERMEQDNSIGTIGPKLIGFDGLLQHSCRAFPRYRHLLFDLTGLAFLFPKSRLFGQWRMSWFDHLSEREVDQPMGAALMIKRAVIERVGRFDEQFKIFFNDVDYCRRVKEAGYKNLYYPDSVIEHYRGGSVRKDRPKLIIESHRAMISYFNKYSGSLVEKLLLILWAPLLYIGGYIRAAIASLRKQS